MFTIVTEAYDALGNLLPEQEYEILSQFEIEDEKLVLGLWVSAATEEHPHRVEPRYLTRQQLDKLIKEKQREKDGTNSN